MPGAAPAMTLAELPIDALLDSITHQAITRGRLVLSAEPGAGKTTRVPAALARALPGTILVLEPRRLAARLAARRVATEAGQKLGEFAGYKVRFEDRTGPGTRVVFMTEGMLMRRLSADAELRGVSAVVFDEFHERSIESDLSLAIVREIAKRRSDPLAIVVMSATLETERVASYLDAETIMAEGRVFPIVTHYDEGPDDRPLDLRVTSGVRKATSETDGDVLVFLPGQGEIRRAERALEKLARERAFDVRPLYADLSLDDQARATERGPRRKVVLATNVAESSITVDGVTAVVDSGLVRKLSHDPWSGFGVLETVAASAASLDQRRGRAGRLRPGVCIRLMTASEARARHAHDPPEIEQADLAPLVLQLAAWKSSSVTLLDPPKDTSRAAAVALLSRLGALDEAGAVTGVGRAMLGFPLHPRLSRLVVEGARQGVLDDACIVAALLSERELEASRGPTRTHDRSTERSDLARMRDRFLEAEAVEFKRGSIAQMGLDPEAVRRAARARDQLLAIAKRQNLAQSESPTTPETHERALELSVLAAFPDRIAKRLRPGARSLALAGGKGSAELSEASVVRDAELMVAARLQAFSPDGRRMRPTVTLASAIEADWLIDLFASQIEETSETTVNESSGRIEKKTALVFDGLTLTESVSPVGAGAERARVFADRVLARGRAFYDSKGELDRLAARLDVARSVSPDLPSLSDERIEEALLVLGEHAERLSELVGPALAQACEQSLGPAAAKALRELAPEHVVLARGRRAKIHYPSGQDPYISSRLQDFFGMTETPSIAKGRVPLRLHLLAPNARAVQITSDLGGFWQNHYPRVRKELARRYPKHAWPENPNG